MLFKKYEISVEFHVFDKEKIEEALWLLGIEFEEIEQSKLFPEHEDRRSGKFHTKDFSLMKRLDALINKMNCKYGYNVSW